MPNFPALTHVAITVSDLDASTAWYQKLLDAQPVLDEDEESGNFHHTVFALGGGTLFGLHTHTTNSGGTHPFSELNVGLDHIAFACTQSELEDWVARLDEAGIEHSGIKHAHYGSGISFRDPDNIALEFFAPPAG
ncbi:VOC family protein [Gordonia amicalis]|uniref:VOC family protein n=1 Tax=Gordonia amicalis TaxID=89053 RepID=A0ABU4DC98_9ACTN|nr:VOC family protein [Gordonia amicalis]MDV6307353.1 VOC family protein [Gordonia amicalis]MDV7101282.1 VOC family protein [Gordonia amicalis]MDV7175729.1 VOC family protein [Gordonia amicalis]NKX77565.1 VOC family protein [Gordonia amicalis]UOG21894.1 VOC family protein [Gordonia amicalis]